MADPLSIASGVAGLVSLGLTLCGGLHNYLSSVKGRHQDIESASRSLTLMQSNLFIIQSSILKLGHRHALSANGVNQGLANCEFELLALQQLMLNLTRDEGSIAMKGKMRKQIMIARYPFDQKKLVQLQDQLSKANATLSSFVQSFNLDINIGISEDLRILKNYTNANDSITHNMLGTIARRLDAITPAVQRTEMQMATLSQRVQENSLDTRSDVSDVVVQLRYLQNSQKEETMTKTLNDPECTCSGPSASFALRKPSYVSRFWGVLIVSRQEHIRQRHHPSCVLFRQSLQASKTTLTYLGLLCRFSRILSLSATQDYPAGAYSLSFGIQSCNIVESSPASQALYNLYDKYKNDRTLNIEFDLLKDTAALIKNLRAIYKSAAASPFDVDKYGNNIAHQSMRLYRIWLLPSLQREDIGLENALASLRSLLSYMFDVGVPISASNFYQETILHDLWAPDSLMVFFLLYDFIATFDTSFCCTGISKHRTMNFLGSKTLSDDELLQVWRKHPEITEELRLNDIFRVVAQQDRQKFESIMMGDQLPASILNRDIYGRNILHASITWPEGLGILLQHSQTLYPLYDQPLMIIGPLEVAARSSGKICTQPDKWVLCQNCKCADSTQLLLEVDCCLPTGLLDQRFLGSCSLRCRRLLLRHYKNRRQRLRDITIALLPPEVIHRYRVMVDSIPDATAAFLWDELQSRSDELRRQGFEVSSGLKPYYSINDFCGFFERLRSPKVCALASEFGIRPTDECGIEPILARVEVLEFTTFGPTFDAETTYLCWLMSHNLKLEYMRGGFQTSALHKLGGRIGCSLDYRDRKSPYVWKREAIGFITKICTSDIECNLPCPCASGVFNRPLASLFSASTTYMPYIDPCDAMKRTCSLVDLIQSIATGVDMSYLARCAVHMNTMKLLGIRHVGPCAWMDASQRRELDEEERLEILEEDKNLLKRLDDLDEEFEQEFHDRNESVADFLQGYYLRRMEKVVRGMTGPVGNDYRRGLIAAGVILEAPEEGSCNSWLD